MRAHAGDWLIIERGDVDHQARRGRIEEVRSADGAPPYVVRWLDTDHTVLVFPGPDAHVLSPEELERTDAAAANRFAAIQREIVRASRATNTRLLWTVTKVPKETGRGTLGGRCRSRFSEVAR